MRLNIPLRNELKESLDRMSEETGISTTSLIIMSATWLVKNYESSDRFFKNLLARPDDREDFEPHLTGVKYDDAIEKLERAGEFEALNHLKAWTSEDGYSKRGWDSYTKNVEGEFVKRFGKNVSNIIWRQP